MNALQCDMSNECSAPVTHIGDKGYIYCKAHAIRRWQSGYEHTRKMTPREYRLIESGKVIPSYYH